jgi:copper chaperone CopZ
MKNNKIKRTIFLVAFFFAVLLGTLCITGCPSTQQRPSSASILKPDLHMPTYKVYVKGLVCPSCAVGLKKGLMKLPFIKSIHVNYKTGLVLIYEIDNRIDHKGIKRYDKSRITKAVDNSGYKVDRFVK